MESTLTYHSVPELADAASKHVAAFEQRYGVARNFNGVDTWDEAYELATHGSLDDEPEAMRIADSAIESVELIHDMDSFTPVWDVAGCEVDVARYLSREPENMIDYHLTSSPRTGRVITLCAAVVYSASVSTETIKRRGHAVAALAFALSRLGMNVETWADYSVEHKRTYARIRTLVKGANDELDTSKIMFAYTHPAMSRVLCFSAFANHPAEVQRARSGEMKFGNANIREPRQDLPEGTIYLPPVISDHDVPDADEMLREHLAELGIIARSES